MSGLQWRTSECLRITIDGVSGSGKGSTAKELVKVFATMNLSLTHLDIGAVLRSIGVYAIQNQLENDFAAVIERLSTLKIEFGQHYGEQVVLLNNSNISRSIRDPNVEELVQRLSNLPQVKDYAFTLLRQMAVGENIVADGRDAGNIVFKDDAQLKIFLDADLEVRAKRRYKEQKANGFKTTFEIVFQQMKQRDDSDRTRVLHPVTVPVGAVKIDSTKLSLDEVVGKIVVLLMQRELIKYVSIDALTPDLCCSA